LLKRISFKDKKVKTGSVNKNLVFKIYLHLTSQKADFFLYRVLIKI